MSQRAHSAPTGQTSPGRDFTDDEWEFARAMERYRHVNRRRFPTCREVLTVLKSLGYRKIGEATADPRPAA